MKVQQLKEEVYSIRDIKLFYQSELISGEPIGSFKEYVKNNYIKAYDKKLKFIGWVHK